MVPRPYGRGCPETPLLPGLQVTDSVCPEFSVLEAHKETVLGRYLSGKFAISKCRTAAMHTAGRIESSEWKRQKDRVARSLQTARAVQLFGLYFLL